MVRKDCTERRGCGVEWHPPKTFVDGESGREGNQTGPERGGKADTTNRGENQPNGEKERFVSKRILSGGSTPPVGPNHIQQRQAKLHAQ